jgi:hypothetical protein
VSGVNAVRSPQKDPEYIQPDFEKGQKGGLSTMERGTFNYFTGSTEASHDQPK